MKRRREVGKRESHLAVIVYLSHGAISIVALSITLLNICYSYLAPGMVACEVATGTVLRPRSATTKGRATGKKGAAAGRPYIGVH